jgi:hypothetical protein
LQQACGTLSILDTVRVRIKVYKFDIYDERTMTNTEIKILIVGAGPTGLTLASDLARRGVQFRIVDKAAAYFIGSKGKGLQPRSLEVMDDLGIIDQILRNGRFHVPFRGYDGSKVLGERDIHERRSHTEHALHQPPANTSVACRRSPAGSLGTKWRQSRARNRAPRY